MTTTRQDTTIAALLAAIGVTGVGFYVAGPPPWLPDWLGAACAMLLLFAVFFVYRSAGALRGWIIALFAAALAVALLLGLR